jgi:pimeloyl-ACP methyl ester carboxylesterase
MDYWDPLLINSLASTRPVVLFDNAGVGQSSGSVADTIKGMAQHVIDFLSLIGLERIDLLGFSIGGMCAQMVALNAPAGTIRKLIIAGSTPSVGENMAQHPPEQQQEVGKLASQPVCDYNNCFYRLFFHPSKTSQEAGQAWWKRVHERDQSTSGEERTQFVSTNYADGGAGFKAMAAAGKAWNEPSKRADGSYDRLGELKMPVFIAQGLDDFMIPTINSYSMQQKVPDGRLKIYPDSGHGFLYQFAEEFGGDVICFLNMS